MLVLFWYGLSIVLVWFWYSVNTFLYAFGTFWYCFGMVLVWFGYGFGMTENNASGSAYAVGGMIIQ